MALDESVDGLEVLQAGDLTAYIDANLLEYVTQMGQIYIDYAEQPDMPRGAYSIMIGSAAGDCSSGSCSSGGCS